MLQELENLCVRILWSDYHLAKQESSHKSCVYLEERLKRPNKPLYEACDKHVNIWLLDQASLGKYSKWKLAKNSRQIIFVQVLCQASQNTKGLANLRNSSALSSSKTWSEHLVKRRITKLCMRSALRTLGFQTKSSASLANSLIRVYLTYQKSEIGILIRGTLKYIT